MSPAPVMPHEIDRLRQLHEFALKPVTIGINRTVKARRDGEPKSGWRKTKNMMVAQMREEIVPDRLGFRISVDKNDGHHALPKTNIRRTFLACHATPPNHDA